MINFLYENKFPHLKNVPFFGGGGFGTRIDFKSSAILFELTT